MIKISKILTGSEDITGPQLHVVGEWIVHTRCLEQGLFVMVV